MGAESRNVPASTAKEPCVIFAAITASSSSRATGLPPLSRIASVAPRE